MKRPGPHAPACYELCVDGHLEADQVNGGRYLAGRLSRADQGHRPVVEVGDVGLGQHADGIPERLGELGVEVTWRLSLFRSTAITW